LLLLTVDSNKKVKVVPVRALKPYGGAEVKRHTFLTPLSDEMGRELHAQTFPRKYDPIPIE
jgi:hypothetical protein